MLRHKKAQITRLPNYDGPPEPTPVDLEIARNQGSSVAIEATQERLQAAKKMPTTNPSETIEQKTREGYLQQELAFQLRMNRAYLCLEESVIQIDKFLQDAINEFQKSKERLMNEREEIHFDIPRDHRQSYH